MKNTLAVLALLVLSACAKSESYDLATLRYHAAMERWCLSSPDIEPCRPYQP